MNREAWVKHKWGDIRRTGHKLNVVVAMSGIAKERNHM